MAQHPPGSHAGQKHGADTTAAAAAASDQLQQRAHTGADNTAAATSDHQQLQQLHQQQHDEHVMPPPRKGFSKVLEKVAFNLHFLTFLPLIFLVCFQDVFLHIAAVCATAVAAFILTVGYFLKRGGYIKVYPKPFDIFNLCLFGSMIPLSLLAHAWMVKYVSLYTSGANALFMWASILLPWDNFVMASVRDRVPDSLAGHPTLRRMALAIALTWATALSLMTLGAVLLLALRVPPREPRVLIMAIGYGLGAGPLLLAFPVQLVIAHVYRKRLAAEYAEYQARQQQQQLGGGDVEGPDARAAAAAAGNGVAAAGTATTKSAAGAAGHGGDDLV